MQTMTLPDGWRLRSTLPGAAWPAVPDANAALVMVLLAQFEQSQWLPRSALDASQLAQLDAVVRHAAASVPWYSEHWRDLFDASLPLTLERFATLPILPRRALQENFVALQSRAVPPTHGGLSESGSSGSTGMPVRVRKTGLNTLLWNAFALRDHLWHARDLGQVLCVIRRAPASSALDAANWGSPTAMFATGAAYLCPITVDIDAQLDWLAARDPGYLLTYPSIALALAELALKKGVRLPRLKEVRTFGEPLDQAVRQACCDAWGAPVTDTYSSEEIGYIALRCREGDRYHVQSEGVLLEVLDEQNRPCAPGQPGRVVVTSLHNFAMPLIRYELGDYAVLGEACSCGRGLPVLDRILGRVRNTLIAADGRRYWPTFGFRDGGKAVPVAQRQIVQKSLDMVEVRYVSAAPLSPAQEETLACQVQKSLPAGFQVSAVRVDAIPRSKGGKFEEFVSEVCLGQ